MKARLPVLLAVFLLFVFGGCQTRPQSEKMEVLTHTFTAAQAAQLPAWAEAIETTVAPEDWNEEDCPHRITVQGATMTVRTTKENQEVIATYLKRMMSAPVVSGPK